jgi:hypothetical protein
MQKAPIPNNEDKRLCAVRDLNILDTGMEERFDRITKEAIEKFQVPVSTITIVDKEREWFKSAQGLKIKEGPRYIFLRTRTRFRSDDDHRRHSQRSAFCR